ncbi:threonine aldolase family protein [Pseudonocardia xinjiangensis]|uniref:threonine aldolase family protein n=1 Tax=Pseudonocardia xinjiangensis TaxID=75289 RepID=UPI003D910CC0
MAGPEVRRSLSSHAQLRRMPALVLQRMIDHLPPDTPPSGPDGPVEVLQQRIADLLGTPAALFFPTGAMAQQVALRVHAGRRGRVTFAAHPTNHLTLWEQQGFSAVHGLRYHPIGDPNRLLTVEDLAAVAEPLAAVVFELPQREIGGQLPAWDDLVAQVELARERGAAVHLDGARLWEAQPYYERSFAEISALFDSVYVSLYKGLQGVRGAVLAADRSIVDEAAVWRHRLGGAIPEAWPLAVSALIGLDDLLPRMPAFRDHAVAIAAAVNAGTEASTVPAQPPTPLFHVHLPVSKDAADRAQEAMLAEHGTQLFSRTRTSPDPNRCAFEVSVGENAMEFTPAEVVGLLRELLDRATDRAMTP